MSYRKNALRTCKQKQIHALIGFAIGVGAFGLASSSALAQEKVDRITVTGSSIKRVASEGALPVQTIGKEEIQSSGATSVSELMQALPAMQGFTTSSDSVGGSGGGVMTASLHDIGEEYTLVLLNGRRLAPRGSGSVVDLNSIPLSAIERVEVLTDGASALYGSDAIAGVVNFILKDNQQGSQASVRYSNPQHPGGGSWNASVSTGFGDFDKDGYNVLIALSHDRQDQLKSKDRDFAKSGIISFSEGGRSLYFFNGSGNAIPGNARAIYTNAAGVAGKSVTFNPYLKANGSCAPDNSQIGSNCFFDYTSTIEIQPESDRNSLFGRGTFKVGSNWTGSVDAAFSEYKMTTRIAPYPTGYFTLPKDSALANTYVKPYLTAEQLAGLTRVDARWRALPASNRTTEWDTKSTHLVGTLDGTAGGWDVNAALTYSVNDTAQAYPTGWLLANEFTTAAAAGLINVYGLASDLSSAEKTALSGTIYSGPWDKEKTTMTGVEARGSRPVFKLGGGDALLGLGADYRDYKYSRTVAEANTKELILFLSKDDPYGLKRSTHGLFAELIMPVSKQLEVTGALRYDSIGKVTSTLGAGALNKDETKTTYKLSARLQPTSNLVIRGSVGTGFKAPSMLEIGRPRSEFGVTSDVYTCPFAAGDPLAATCLAGPSQYNVYLQGYDKLKPEKSDQVSLGFVFEPVRGFSAGMDYWEVKIKDLVTQLTEQQIFAEPGRYRDLFTTKKNLATGDLELAIIQGAVNASKSVNKGIDWRLMWDNKLPIGKLSTVLSGTHLMDSKYTRPGTDIWVTSLGQFGENNAVSFKNLVKLTANLKYGGFSHSVAANYKSGYKDVDQTAADCAVSLVDANGDCADVRLNVPSYTTVDWQTSYAFTKMFDVRGGINNLFDRKPPLSLRTGGAGHQVGYDPRYTDSLGRTFYVAADFKF